MTAIDKRPIRQFMEMDDESDTFRKMLLRQDARIEVNQILEVFDDDIHNEHAHEWCSVSIPLCETRKHADAFIAFSKTLDYATRDTNELTELVLLPTDEGLVKRIGRVNPNWHSIFISYQNGEILQIGAIFCVSESGESFESSQAFPYPQTQPDSLLKLEAYFQDFLKPRTTLVLTVDVRTPLVLDAECFTDDHWIEWDGDLTREGYKPLPKSRLSTTRQLFGRYETRLAQKALIDKFGIVRCSDADKAFVSVATFEQEWMIEAPYRWPFQLAAMIQFSLGVSGRLPPYCILWVFGCIPAMLFHSEHKRIAALEKIAASIRTVKEKRASKRATRSQTRLLSDEWY